MRSIKKPKMFGTKKSKGKKIGVETPAKIGTRASRKRKSKLDQMPIGDFVKGRNTGMI